MSHRQIDLVKGMLDCLYAECTPCITDCVMAELEKLGQKYRVALKIAKVWPAVNTDIPNHPPIHPTPTPTLTPTPHALPLPSPPPSPHVCVPRAGGPARAPQDPRIERIACTHKGTYADDCLCERVRQHKCYIVATCDKDLRRRLRKVGPACRAHACIAWCCALQS